MKYSDDLILRYVFHNHRPMFVLRGVQVWPEWGFHRSGQAEKLKGKNWGLSRKYADQLMLESLRRSVLGVNKTPGVWWVPEEYDSEWR